MKFKNKERIFNISKQIVWYSVSNLGKIGNIDENDVCCSVCKILGIDFLPLSIDSIIKVSSLDTPEVFLWLRNTSLESKIKILELCMWYYTSAMYIRKGMCG